MIYEILNNATVAGILAVLLAAFVASREYRAQKNRDRDSEVKTELINDVILLKEKADYVLFIIDRIASTMKIATTKEELTEDGPELFKDALKREIPKLSHAINEEIPTLLTRVSSKIDLYSNGQVVIDSFKEFEAELKRLHGVIFNMRFDPSKRISEQEELSPDEFHRRTKNLTQSIWNEETTYSK